MAKVRLSMNRAFFHCPGCGFGHAFRIRAPANDSSGPVWEFNGDVDKPTFSPSLLLDDPKARCHLFVRDGKIEFCSDCHHALAGTIVEMQEV